MTHVLAARSTRLAPLFAAPLSVLVLVLVLGSAHAPPRGQGGMDLGDPTMRIPVEHWGCTNCHAPSEEVAALVATRPGPDLSGVGERLSAEWMRRWIARPADLRGAPGMPRLFGESPQEARDLDALVNYLASLGTPAGGAAATEAHVLDQGRELYHTLGCVACHGALESPAAVFDDEFLEDEVPSPFVVHSFGDLEGKWYPRALSRFLREPQEVHRDGRMPRMDLSESEADLIANYLLSRFAPASGAHVVERDRIARGREVFAERGCQACHVIEGEDFAPFEAAPLAAVAAAARTGRDSKGCLSSEEWDGPRYDFPAPALARMFRGSLLAAASASAEDVQLDSLARRVQHLNCAACHEIDGSGGVPEGLRPYFVSLDEMADLGDEGRFPPHLNDVGEKLTTTWFEEVLQHSGRARPYLATRMPQYGDAAAGLPELFARKHGVEPHSDAEWPAVDDASILLGREMMGPTAMACMNCHNYKDYPPLGTPGPDITRFAERLRYAWWDEYIEDPAAKKPGTRMPSFTHEGKSAFTNFAGGDFQKQTDAMWAYFSLGEFMPAPEGVEKGKSLVLEVGEEPRILRTFLESAGTRAIAVGFPVGVHYAYDARHARLAEIWRGDFLDASGAWAGRGGNSTDAEGPVLWTHPGGPAFVIGAQPATWPAQTELDKLDFQGYQRGAANGPVFRYRVGDVLVNESITPHALPMVHVVRRFEFDGLEPGVPLWFRPGGALRATRVEGATEYGPRAGDGDETWFRVLPEGDACSVTLEVSL